MTRWRWAPAPDGVFKSVFTSLRLKAFHTSYLKFCFCITMITLVDVPLWDTSLFFFVFFYLITSSTAWQAYGLSWWRVCRGNPKLCFPFYWRCCVMLLWRRCDIVVTSRCVIVVTSHCDVVVTTVDLSICLSQWKKNHALLPIVVIRKKRQNRQWKRKRRDCESLR